MYSLLASDSSDIPRAPLPLPLISLIALSLPSKQKSLHYSTIYPTNKHSSVSSPNVSFRTYLTSSLQTSSFTYLLTIPTHPGNNGMAHLPQASTISPVWCSWPLHTSCPRLCYHDDDCPLQCSPRISNSQEPAQLPPTPNHRQII